jgi:hypothetical protein
MFGEMRRVVWWWTVPTLAVVGLGALATSPGPSNANAAVECARYASPSGSDRNPGTRARPFRTAQRLVRSLKAGRTGCLRRGRYRAEPGDYVLRFGRAGAPGAPITVRGYP